MGTRVELFEQIRRDHDREELSIHALARRHRVHRRTVRQALESPLPPPRKKPEGRPAPVLGPYHDLIDEWLEGDREAPPKQRHTAKRVWERLVTEKGAKVAERTVREHVAKRRRELGLGVEGHVPQAHDPGAEAEVDWGEAKVRMGGELVKAKLFLMRLSHSGAAYVEAFPHETQQAFLEGHANAFAFLGGIPAKVRYDNLKAAVVKVLRGRRRVESDRFVALRSHYLYESFFCEPGEKGAHEKGGVEGEVGRFRRGNLVPVPEVDSFEALNALLRAACESELGRQITGREVTIGEALAAERPALRPLPAERFDATEVASVRVDCKSMVTVRQNRYSVPSELLGRRVEARVGARRIEIYAAGKAVASHERLRGRHQVRARLAHYAGILARKPGAMAGSVALAQERERGEWPECFDRLWRAIGERTTASEAARQMVDVVLLCEELGLAKVELAVHEALAAGALDGRAVAVLARQAERPEPSPLVDLEERLAKTAAPSPGLAEYDQLLGAAR
jgi:transposase